jgi:hypothetical protein
LPLVVRSALRICSVAFGASASRPAIFDECCFSSRAGARHRWTETPPLTGKPAAPLCFEDAESLKDREPLVKLPEACYFDRFNRLISIRVPSDDERHDT